MELAVTELALGSLVRAPLSGRGGAPSPFGGALGASRHRRYQDLRLGEDPTYRAEHPLRAELLHRGWTVELRGRADGVQGLAGAEETPLLVEEVKTGIGKLEPGGPKAQAYALQAATYAWMLARETGRRTEACLVWWPLEDDAPSRIPLTWSEAETEARLRDRLDHVLAAVEARSARLAQRREAAGRLTPPHPTWRPAQEEMRRAALHALEHGEHLLLQAPTGTGKTAATLLPVARAALEQDRRVFYLTSRRTQQRLPLATLAHMAPPDLPFAVQLRAKRDLCATGVVWCHEAACALAADPGERGEAVLEELLAEGVLQGETLLERGTRERVCPYGLAHTAGERMPISVADVHHLVSPNPLRSHAGEDVFEGAIVVVDEIHNLLERAREAGSLTLDAGRARAALERAALGSDPHHRAQRELAERALNLLEESARDAGLEGGSGWVLHAHPHEALARLAEELEPVVVQSLIRSGTEGFDGGPDPFVELALGVAQLAEGRARPGCVTLVGRLEGGEPALRRLELDPSPRLRDRFAGLHALIGLSATLEPAALHRDGLGLDPDRTHVVHVPGPPPEDRQRVVIDPTVDTSFRARARQLPRIAERLAGFAAAVPGNILAVLPSHEVLAEIRRALPEHGGYVEAQSPRDGEAERSARLALLEVRRDVLLLAVAGGLYTEGVDYPGDRLQAVAVVGPCLPPPTLERRLLAEHLEERLGEGRDAAFAVPGMVRVVQAVGRLLRGPEDRGVVALFGRRFLREPYRSLLPDTWLGGQEPEELAGDAAQVARDFFADG